MQPNVKFSTMYLFVYLGPQHWARGGTNILIKIKKDENSKKIINKVNVKYNKQIYAISLSWHDSN